MESYYTINKPPFVPHPFTTRKTPTSENGLILAFTYGARLAGDAQRELSLIDKKDVHRAIGETTQWYDPKGKK